MQRSLVAESSSTARLTTHLLLGDGGCAQIRALIGGAVAPTLALSADQHGLSAVSDALAQRRAQGHPPGVLHLIAHGRPGAFRIGDTWIDAEVLKAHAADLAQWGVQTIALWSCCVAADADVVVLLAELSGARVLASADWLGRDEGGNEQLQLGAWSLADVSDATAWPAAFRLATAAYDEITTELLRQRLSSRPDDLLLLDVRPLETSAADAIDGAVRIPWPTIESGEALEQVRALAAGKDVHVICQSGGWSSASSQFLVDQGIEVTNVAGGMNAWSLEQGDVKAASISSFSGAEKSDSITGNWNDLDPKDLPPGVYFTADNGSHVYLNGEQLGYTWSWINGFRISLDNAVLRPGKNVIAIAGWDSEEIAGINGLFKFSDTVSFGTSGLDDEGKGEGWKVWNAENKDLVDAGETNSCIGDRSKNGDPFNACTGLQSYERKFDDSGKKIGDFEHPLFPKNEEELKTQYTLANRGLEPNIPDGWAQVDFNDDQWENPGYSLDNPGPWEGTTPDPTWLWYGNRLSEIVTDGATSPDKDPKNPWTFNNLTLFRFSFESLFAITETGMCEEETDFGSTTQVVKAGFTIEFDGPLGSDKTFDYELSGDGGDVEFGIPDGGVYAFDADGPVDGVELIDKPKYNKETNTYSGQLSVSKGVENVVLGARWEKKSGDLTGQESVTLTFTEGNGQEGGVITTDTKTVVLDHDGDGNIAENCPPDEALPELNFDVVGSGFCAKDLGDQLATAAFTITFDGDAGLTSAGRLRYVLTGDGDGGDFDVVEKGLVAYDASGEVVQGGVTPDGVPSYDAESNTYEGTIVVAADVKRIELGASWKKSNGELTGEESVSLTVIQDNGLSTVSKTGVATLDHDGDGNIDENCPPDVPPLENEFELDATAACLDADATQAEVEFTVTGKPENLSGFYNYALSYGGDGSADDTISAPVITNLDGQLLVADRDYWLVPDSDTPGSGTIQILNPALAGLTIRFEIVSETPFLGSEQFSFSFGDATTVRSVVAGLDDPELNCPEPPESPEEVPPMAGTVYLLMDNSTSMKGSDPSTNNADAPDRLEAQNRLAFYSFQQAASRAGYGFRKIGDQEVQSFGSANTNNIINSGSQTLADALSDYELVDLPDDGFEAQDLTVNLITFGYVVEHQSVTFTAEDPITGVELAKSILLTTTPDQVYGNSIDGNPIWSERNLPQPDERDLFRGDGRLASNLYSGTEMYGALKGLESLLFEQAIEAVVDPLTGEEFVFVVLTTDGRPERRPWWGNRSGDGTGVNVSLPESLGGDAVTSAGLLYDNAGNPVFIADNSGTQQWTPMQADLNRALDLLASGADDPLAQVQVRAVGLGDGSEANFPAIYNDLLGLQTFNGDAAWSYDYASSFRLPEFLG